MTGDKWNAIVEKAHAGNGRFVLHDGLVCYALHGEEAALVVPTDNDLRTELLMLHHDSPLAGHLGLYCMLRALSKRYYWKGLHHDCSAHIWRCCVC